MIVPPSKPILSRPNPLQRIARVLLKGSNMPTAQIIPLPERSLPCSSCGVAVPRGEAETHGIETVRSHGRARASGSIRLQHDPNDRPFDTPMGSCEQCAALREQATEVSTKYLGSLRVGNYTYTGESAIARITDALRVLAALGEQVDIQSARDLRLLVSTLALPGVQITWRARFAPVAALDARPGTSSASAWSHLSRATLRALGAEYARFRVRRVERAVALRPPIGLACAACGVSSVKALPSHREHVWRTARIRVANDSDLREVSLCAGCWSAYERERAFGPSMMMMLVLAAAGIDKKRGSELLQVDPPSWIELKDIEPNEMPWQHLDLARMRTDFELGRIRRL